MFSGSDSIAKTRSTAATATASTPREGWTPSTRNNIAIYIDGEDAGGEHSGGAESMSNGSDNFVLGLQRADGDKWSVGSLDELRIYDRALAAQEVKTLTAVR